MLLLIPLLPLVGFLLNASFGRRMTKAAAGAIACGAMILSFVVALTAVIRLVGMPAESREIAQQAFSWITSGDFNIPFTFRVDPLASVMILVVTGIGSLIHIYSTAYMHEESDPEYARYFSYLNLFASFMLVLVLGSTFLTMFVGWEGVGLCSYLLIGFWYQKKSASDAGKKAFIVNRIGDWGFILGMLLTFVRFGTLDFQHVARQAAGLAPETAFGTLSWITLLLFIGATGKSAQIPLYIWLPDAMEGPTPVSALIHAATMVTAGVYMIGRNAVLFQHAPETLAIVAVIGVLTALMAGTIGLVQNDIKRVLAYSTVSQLGYMFLAMGVGAYAAGIFHLYTHAFFKALLFLGSGAVIHALAGEQDLRRMGGLKDELPVTYWTFLIGAIAIAGVPGFSGFFSKDEILFRTFAGGHTLLWVVGLVTSLLTAIYMFRVVFLTFHGTRADAAHDPHAAPAHPEEEEPPAQHSGATAIGPGGGPVVDDARGTSHDARGTSHSAPGTQHGAPGTPHIAPAPSTRHAAPSTPVGGHLHDAPPAMAIALIVLAIGSVVAGYVGLPGVMGGSRFERFLEPSFAASAQRAGVGDESAAGTASSREHDADEASEGLEWGLMAVSSLVAIGGIAIAFYFFVQNRRASREMAERFAGAHRLLLNKYYVDEIYDATIVQPIRIVSEQGLWKGVDVHVIDATVNGVGEMVRGSSGLLRRIQTGSVRAYAASLFFGVVLILGYYLWR